MIEKMPVEIEPPSPMPAPPLRKRPSITPQFVNPTSEPSVQRLFIDESWN